MPWLGGREKTGLERSYRFPNGQWMAGASLPFRPVASELGQVEYAAGQFDIQVRVRVKQQRTQDPVFVLPTIL